MLFDTFAKCLQFCPICLEEQLQAAWWRGQAGGGQQAAVQRPARGHQPSEGGAEGTSAQDPLDHLRPHPQLRLWLQGLQLQHRLFGLRQPASADDTKGESEKQGEDSEQGDHKGASDKSSSDETAREQETEC